MTYKLKLDVFEGPLDLLLYLIKKNDIDIANIPIAKVTEQYMAYIEMMKMLDLDVIGDFLVMAATLMHIKSKMLLPPDPTEEEEEQEDPRDELVRRLLEYKKFKEIAEELREKASHQQDLFKRTIDAERLREIKEEATETYFEANLFDLITALDKALNRLEEQPVYEVTQEKFTVEDKIHAILHILLEKSSIMFSDLLARARSREEVIVTFMAVLELIRLKEIQVIQKRQFEDIEVVRNKENVIPVEQKQEG